jgi:signal peptidase I
MSTAPTIKVGAVVLVDRGAYKYFGPRHGDIVIFIPPVPSADPFIKRVIAVPGDTLTTQGHHILVNGTILREPYLREPMDYQIKIAEYGLYATIPGTNDWQTVRIGHPPDRTAWRSASRVPVLYYVLLGDNRNNSEDSHVFGLVSRLDIVGKMVGYCKLVDRYKS